MPKRFKFGFPLFCVALLLQLSTTPSYSADSYSTDKAYIAIIIDDIGNNRRLGERAINIPADLTFAVIPETTHATKLARYAHQSGKEVMVHLPMENTHNQPMGSIALTSELSRADFAQVFDDALSRVPFAAGINNHMGSELTQQPLAMSWLMDSVKRHKLFFVDSRTTHKTIASDIARQQNVLSASRDIFLDNNRSAYDIDKQFRRLLILAKRRQTAIAIGHPHRATLEYLERAIPMLEDEGITIVSVSYMLKMRRAQRQMASSAAAGD